MDNVAEQQETKIYPKNGPNKKKTYLSATSDNLNNSQSHFNMGSRDRSFIYSHLISYGQVLHVQLLINNEHVRS